MVDILNTGAILYNEAEVFSLSITNPNGQPYASIALAYSLRSNFSALPVSGSFTNAIFFVIAFRPFSH